MVWYYYVFLFKENIIDRCIYLKVSGSKFIFLILYVDYILLETNDLSLLLRSLFQKTLKWKDMAEANYVIK